MEVISLWQPYASLMAMNLKKNETRHWLTYYRGPLLIHAAKRKPTIKELVYIRNILERFTIEYDFLDQLPLGAILCEVNLVDCQRIHADNCPSKDELEYWLGGYNHGRFMWHTEDVKPFAQPIPYKGSQGFWKVPDEVINKFKG